MSTHYSEAFSPIFRQHCYNAATKLVAEFQEAGKGYPVLCYSGFSGITAATLIAAYLHIMNMRVEHIYVRKEGEKSYGDSVEFSCRNLGELAVPVFVDDFVDSGETHNRVLKAVNGLFTQTTNHSALSHYEPWSGFFFLTDLEHIDARGDRHEWDMMMPYVLIDGDGPEVNLQVDKWVTDVP